MVFIGVDPGVNGGIAIISETGAVQETCKMPVTDRDILDALAIVNPALARAMLERAHASPQMGVTSAFTFGGGYRALRMALTAIGIPFDIVTSHVWQKTLGCRSGGDKNVTKARAQQLFPSIKVTHAIADALLLAEYGRRQETGARLTPGSVEQLRITDAALGGLFDGKENESRTEEAGKIRIEEGFYARREDADRAEAKSARRRARAH